MFSLKNFWIVVATQIRTLDSWNHLLLQKVLINFGVDSFANSNKNDWTLLVVIAHHPPDYLLQRSLGKRERCGCWSPQRPQGDPSSSCYCGGWQPCLWWRSFQLKTIWTWLGWLAFSLLRSLWHLPSVKSRASGVRSGHWTIAGLVIPRSSFTRFLIALGSMLWCLASCLMLCWGISAMTTWPQWQWQQSRWLFFPSLAVASVPGHHRGPFYTWKRGSFWPPGLRR